MDDEINKEDNIDIFYENFDFDGSEEQILNFYNINKKIENNDIIAKKIVKNIYNHPLFLNYNYCLFCLERRKTKFNQKNLIDKHKKSNIKNISSYLKKENIRLKYPENKMEKLAKRRFIHSCEHKEKEIINNKYSESDTELYIEEEEIINLSNKYSKVNEYKKRSSNFLFNSIKINSSFNSEISNNNKIIKYNSKEIKLNKIKQTKSSAENEPENIIFQRRNKKLKSTKKVKPLSFFGFMINPFQDRNENDSNDIFIEPTEEGQLQYYEKNEKCGICLGEIKDKFTLFCGDFFCRECIINLLEESINNISLFNKLNCPSCKEPINENTIKFLLKGKSLRKYNKQKMRIDGLKNPDNVPCPFPDCEGFALKDNEKNNTYKCQNGHIFCKKCLEIIDKQYRVNPNLKHDCEKEDKSPETTKYFENNKNIKKCPKCKCWVEREPGGCNYFRCNNIWCKYEFCWLCGNKYEPSHYKNPLSTCFRLQEGDYQGKFLESNRIRRIRCILIMLLLILILSPIVCIFFSLFSIFSFVLYFYFDGKEMRNIRLKSKLSHKIFYIFYFAFIILTGLALIPFGYMCLAMLLIAIPIIIIIRKVKKKKYDF
jgi:hypothetical protein